MMKLKTAFKRMSALLLLALLVAAALAFAQGTAVRAAQRSGDMANLVIFVSFADTPADNADIDYGTPEHHDEIIRIYDTAANSVANYLHEISGGALTLKNIFPQETVNGEGKKVFSVLKLSNNAAYYTGTEGEGRMIEEIARAFRSGAVPAPSAKLDNFESGLLDNLTIAVTSPELTSNDPNFVSHFYHTAISPDRTINGSSICNYNVVTTYNYLNHSSVSGKQGTVAHELLHTLGLPDLYRQSGSGEPVGMWSIMSKTLSDPQYPLEFCRELLGWADIPEITADGRYTVRLPSIPGNTSVPTALKFRTSASDREFFVVEYRRDSAPGATFDDYLTGSGLLVYRVDDSVLSAANYGGENYIYVFRPDVTDPEMGNDTTSGVGNNVNSAAIDPDGGVTAYGAADLSAGFGQNTIYYSGGKNSGIVLSNIAYSPDKTQMSFDISFPDLSASDMWQDAGRVDNVSPSGVSLVSDGSGNIYATALDSDMSGRLRLYKNSGGAFSEVTSLPGMMSTTNARLCMFDGTLYLFATKTGAVPAVYYLSGGGFVEAASVTTGAAFDAYPAVYNDTLYLAYLTSDNTSLRFKKVSGPGGDIAPMTLGEYTVNPALCEFGGRLYAVCSTMPTSGQSADNSSKIYCYDGAGWSTVRDLGVPLGNVHGATASNGTAAFFASNSSGQKALLVYDGTAFSSVDISPVSTSLGLSMAFDASSLYLNVTDSRQNLTMYTVDGLSLKKVGDSVASGVNTSTPPCIVPVGDKLYTAYVTSGSQSLVMRCHQKSSATVGGGSGGETAPDYTVTLPLGGSATPGTVYVDGRAVSASASGGSLTFTLSDGSAKTVVRYPADASGVPTGMQVWLLRFSGGRYTSVRQSALENLLTYHGFSIRISGDAGIRFKTGIAADVKAALTSAAGLDGYRLVEYGTIVMKQANMERGYPLVLGGEKVAGGRSYWISGGTVTDRVFETVGGRQRFTSVLVGLPPTEYKTEFAFRGYIILEKNGVRYTLYGPPVARSIYYLAEKLIERGDYAPGTSQDKFLRDIIADAV